jgi:drug/metabolite transporter (DMT)-like permease
MGRPARPCYPAPVSALPTSTAVPDPAASVHPEETASSDNLERAVLFMVAVAFVLPMINACAKYLSTYPVLQVTWARYAGHFIFMLLLFAPRNGLDLLRSNRPALQLTRSTLHCLSALLTFSALATVALPTATAISFSAPLIVTALAPFLLGERVGPTRWFAVGIGFIGALVILRPGGGSYDVAVLLLFGNAAASAMIQILSRKVSRHDRALTSNTYMVLVGFVLTTLPLPFVWQNPANRLDLLIFLAIGVVGGVGHYMLVRAFELAPAAFVSPFNYGQILGATLLGYLIFGQLPDLWTWVGAGIIAGSGLFILFRERHLRRRRLAAAPPRPSAA